MFNFFKFFFSSAKDRGLGARINPEDVRDIRLASFQVPVELPFKYETDISMIPVTDQLSQDSCVGQAEGSVDAYFDWLENKNVDISRRHIYARCKKEDGVPNARGTYPRVAASIRSKRGVTTGKFIPDNNKLPYNDYLNITETEEILKDSIRRKVSYTFVDIDKDALKQAIFQNKMITLTLSVDRSAWRKAKLKAPGFISGAHRILVYGWNGDTFKFRNSWGTSWGKKGNGEFDFEDYVEDMFDAICYTDVPNELLEEAQNKDFIFTKNLMLGSSGFEVMKLQERLGIIPADSVFGPITKKKVVEFQNSNGLVPDGVVGGMTRQILNDKSYTISRLDLWCEAIKEHEGWYIGSRSYRNKNPGNIKHIGQDRAVGKDSGGFCIFASYEDGYNELKDLLIRAASGKSKIYRPEMSILEFFRKYAPSSDNNDPDVYAKRVAKKIGVFVETSISSLI